MALKISTGMSNYMLDTGSLRSGLNLGFLKIYSGTPPAAADDALGSLGTNTLLVTISNAGGGTGLTMEATAAAGVISKATAETWSGTNAATGTATFYRFTAPGDTGVSSSTQRRLQGTVGTAGAELNLTSTSLTIGNGQSINHFYVSLPIA